MAAIGGAYNCRWCNRNGDGVGVLNGEGTRGYIVGVNACGGD